MIILKQKLKVKTLKNLSALWLANQTSMNTSIGAY